MELWEDKIIKNKLNSLDALPEGYEPNLNSKWLLLEAGLEGGKSKRTILGWYKIAAMFFLIGGGSFLLIKLQQQKAKTALQPEKVSLPILVNTDKKAVEVESKIVPTKHKVAQVKKIKAPLIFNADVKEENKIIEEVAVFDTFPAPNIALVKQKKTRYVEMDFNDQPIGPNAPSESVLAAQQFRFKIGRNSYSSAGSSQGNSLKLRKSFFN